MSIASGAYELVLKYSKERKAFIKQPAQHQAIQFKRADMATQIDAARLLVWKAAYLKNQTKILLKMIRNIFVIKQEEPYEGRLSHAVL